MNSNTSIVSTGSNKKDNESMSELSSTLSETSPSFSSDTALDRVNRNVLNMYSTLRRGGCKVENRPGLQTDGQGSGKSSPISPWSVYGSRNTSPDVSSLFKVTGNQEKPSNEVSSGLEGFVSKSSGYRKLASEINDAHTEAPIPVLDDDLDIPKVSGTTVVLFVHRDSVQNEVTQKVAKNNPNRTNAGPSKPRDLKQILSLIGIKPVSKQRKAVEELDVSTTNSEDQHVNEDLLVDNFEHMSGPVSKGEFSSISQEKGQSEQMVSGGVNNMASQYHMQGQGIQTEEEKDKDIDESENTGNSKGSFQVTSDIQSPITNNESESAAFINVDALKSDHFKTKDKNEEIELCNFQISYSPFPEDIEASDDDISLGDVSNVNKVEENVEVEPVDKPNETYEAGVESKQLNVAYDNVEGQPISNVNNSNNVCAVDIKVLDSPEIIEDFVLTEDFEGDTHGFEETLDNDNISEDVYNDVNLLEIKQQTNIGNMLKGSSDEHDTMKEVIEVVEVSKKAVVYESGNSEDIGKCKTEWFEDMDSPIVTNDMEVARKKGFTALSTSQSQDTLEFSCDTLDNDSQLWLRGDEEMITGQSVSSIPVNGNVYENVCNKKSLNAEPQTYTLPLKFVAKSLHESVPFKTFPIAQPDSDTLRMSFTAEILTKDHSANMRQTIEKHEQCFPESKGKTYIQNGSFFKSDDDGNVYISDDAAYNNDFVPSDGINFSNNYSNRQRTISTSSNTYVDEIFRNIENSVEDTGAFSLENPLASEIDARQFSFQPKQDKGMCRN